jgi:hypothetical protein
MGDLSHHAELDDNLRTNLQQADFNRRLKLSGTTEISTE